MPDDFPESADFGAIRAALASVYNQVRDLTPEERVTLMNATFREPAHTQGWMLWRIACDVHYDRVDDLAARESIYPVLT